MTGLEAVPVINGLLSNLIKRAKDRRDTRLVQEIQEHQFLIQKDLVEMYAKIAKMDADHAQTIAARDSKIAELQMQLNGNQRHFLDDYEHFPRYGLFKRREGRWFFVRELPS